MSIPKISLVMGVFNGPRFLPETVDSVLRQTERDFEFIIVNDGSSDPQVSEILADYERRDGRIRILSKSNEGLTKALIAGCAAARGEYIARIDAGDVMLPERLEKQRALLDRNPEVIFVSCWTEFCGPEWEPLYVCREGIPKSDNGADMLPGESRDTVKYGPPHHGSVTFRSDAYRRAGGYRWQFYYGQDWDLWYRLAELGKFAGVQSTLYRCRILPDGISMQNVKRQLRIHECSYGAFQARTRREDESVFLQAAAALRPAEPKKSDRHRRSAVVTSAGYYFVGEALRRNSDVRCRAYLTKALRGAPWNLKIWIRLGQSFARAVNF